MLGREAIFPFLPRPPHPNAHAHTENYGRLARVAKLILVVYFSKCLLGMGCCCLSHVYKSTFTKLSYRFLSHRLHLAKYRYVQLNRQQRLGESSGYVWLNHWVKDRRVKGQSIRNKNRLKPGSQYDAGASVISGTSLWPTLE